MKPLDHLTIPEAAKMLGVGTPCVRAMIHRGDVITAIDGRPPAKFTLEQVRQLFRQPGGECRLDIHRGDDHFRVKLKLRRLI